MNGSRMWVLLIFVALASVDDSLEPYAGQSHDDAREALEEGEIAPLDEILTVLRARDGGEVLEVELERHGGRWIYEIETLSRDGVISEHWVDAATKTLLPPGREDEHREGPN